jgi:hypothetical protein
MGSIEEVRQITAKDRYARALASLTEWCRLNLHRPFRDPRELVVIPSDPSAVSIPAWRAQSGSLPLSISQHSDRFLRRCGVDRARDPHPNPGRKLDFDRPAAGRPDWTKRSPRFRDHHRWHEAHLLRGGTRRLGAK